MRPAWQLDAACRDYPDPDLWFPDLGATTLHLAVAICRRCPVQAECLDYGLTRERPRYRYGIYGATSANARNRMQTVTSTPVKRRETGGVVSGCEPTEYESGQATA